MSRKILINEADPEERRIAVVENGLLQEIHIDNPSREVHLGNVYKGKVVNIEPSIGAAFVDYGGSRNGFLHASDVLPAYADPKVSLEDIVTGRVESARAGYSGEIDEAASLEKKAGGEEGQGEEAKPKGRGRLPINELLKKGQEVVVQITKDGIGAKGSTLTTYISVPGRYLVFMPSLGKCGVSRKIADEKERNRLKKLVHELAKDSGGIGFIVRTAGVNRTKKELQKDLDYLKKLWSLLMKRLRSAQAPAPLYEESDLAIKTMRDIFTPDIQEVVVDSEDAYKRILEFLDKLMPRFRNRIVHYKGGEPIFHHYGVEAEIETLFDNRIELKSGISIVIEQTEALVAIDVNSGKFKTESDLEETAYLTNMEAIPEIVRQIRLRDLGGMLVIDFIDMMEEKHRKAVEKHLRECLKGDRARVKVGKISQFGMLEMTRQRVGPGLKRMLFAQCPTCRGTGMVRSASSQGLAVLRRLRATLRRKNVDGVEVTVHPDVADYLLNQKRGALFDLERETGRFVRIVPEPSFPGEGVHFQALSRKEEAPQGRNGSRENGSSHSSQQGGRSTQKGSQGQKQGSKTSQRSKSKSGGSSQGSGSKQGSKGGSRSGGGASKRGGGKAQGGRRQGTSPEQGG